VSNLTTPESVQELQTASHDKAKEAPNFRFYALYDKVYRKDVLAFAYECCKANGGAAGVDGQTFEGIESYGKERWVDELAQERKSRTYQPLPVRRAYIPKPDGKQRPLGVPANRGRTAEMAAVLVLEPISSRPICRQSSMPIGKAAAHWTVRHVYKLINTGHEEIVDADLSSYFDTLPHSELLKSVARRVVDGAMLHLIKMRLEAPVEETDERGNKHRSTRNWDDGRGSPQGSPISPLLSNLYMRRFVLGWKKLGYEKRLKAYIVNYADDLVICCRDQATEAFVPMRNMMSKLKLTVNDTKTRVCKLPEEKFDFLGYTFGAMLLAEDGTGLFRIVSVEETGATHLSGDQPRNRTEQDPSSPRESNHDTQSNDDWVGELLLFGASQSCLSSYRTTCSQEAATVAVRQAQIARAGNQAVFHYHPASGTGPRRTHYSDN